MILLKSSMCEIRPRTTPVYLVYNTPVYLPESDESVYPRLGHHNTGPYINGECTLILANPPKASYVTDALQCLLPVRSKYTVSRKNK